ncbi:MAG: hypothetical protein HN741_08770 [Anaerolineae bacterium]|jgi:capsular polysaccharide biosynthesis protein|nr:hypothetical protein [Anaerolineae bacterium]
MMNETNQTFYDDEIDLREIVLTLLKGWKTILLMTVLAGAAAFGYSKMQTPIYEASASVLIDQNALALKSSPVTLLGSEEVRQFIADELEVKTISLPSPTIVNDKTDKTLFTITVQSSNEREAAKIVNAWADASLKLVNTQVQKASVYLALTLLDVEEADRMLFNYLEQHKLSAWTWADLSALTGVSSSSNYPSNTQELPAISDKERLAIAQLMRERVAAEQAYTIALKESTSVVYASERMPPAVLNYATTPTESISPKTLMNTALGLVLGGMLGVFWIFVAGWWQNSATEDKKDINDGKR